jgi:hypothetical protein
MESASKNRQVVSLSVDELEARVMLSGARKDGLNQGQAIHAAIVAAKLPFSVDHSRDGQVMGRAIHEAVKTTLGPRGRN